MNDAELIALAMLTNAAVLGLQAANDQRKALGDSMAYDERDFLNTAQPLQDALDERLARADKEVGDV